MRSKEEAEKLFQENMPIFYYGIKRYLPKLVSDYGCCVDADDLRQACLVGYWRACQKYDASKSELSTYAMKAMLNAALRYSKSALRKSSHGFVSIPNEAKPNISQIPLFEAEEICAEEEKSASEEDEYKKYLWGLLEEHLGNGRAFKSLKLVAAGYTHNQIGEILGCKGSSVSNYVKRGIKYAKKFAEANRLRLQQGKQPKAIRHGRFPEGPGKTDQGVLREESDGKVSMGMHLRGEGGVGMEDSVLPSWSWPSVAGSSGRRRSNDGDST
jgi:RNA polymerase sigma factor (sigma-70 family)